MIKVTDTYGLKWDGLQYTLWKYDLGGKEYTIPKTGEKKISESGWKTEEKYFPKIEMAVKHIMNIESSEDVESLGEFLNVYQSLVDKVHLKCLEEA